MTHKMGLAKISMKTWTGVKNVVFYIGAPSAVADTNYTWDNQATTDVTTSSSYRNGTPKPYQSTEHWYVMSGNTTFVADATQQGVANYAGVGASAATVNADIRNDNSWTTTITCTLGNCTTYTPTTISATSYLARVPYTLEYGDALYSDGALSKTGASSYFWSGRTAIAYVSSIKNASNGASHGYAISIRRHPTLYLWQNAYADSPLTNVATSNFASDYKGYSNTQTLCSVSNASTVYPAAYAAWSYTAKNKTNSGTVSLSGHLASSHWFLPSSGQIYDVVKNIGGITSTPNITATAVHWNLTNVSTTFLNGVNAVLNKFKTNGGYTLSTIPLKYGSPDYSGKGGESTWWTSTEYSANYCYLLIVWQTSQLYFCETSDGGDSDTKRGDSHSVYPCIAF